MALWIVLAYPAILFTLCRRAWLGVQGRGIFTHFGTRSLLVSRVSAVLYFCVAVAFLVFAPDLLRFLGEAPTSSLAESLRYPFKTDLVISLILLIAGLITLPVARFGIKHRLVAQQMRPNQAPSQQWLTAFVYSIPTVMLVCGVLSAIGFPFIVLFGVLLFAFYFMTVAEVLAFSEEKELESA